MIHRMDPPEDPDREPMPERLEPMLARTGDAPARRRPLGASRSSGTACARSATREGGRLRLESRNGNDITPRYPELRELGRALGSREAVLDGEVVAFGPDGRPSFQRLQRRMHLDLRERACGGSRAASPVAYVIFDLLCLDGHSLMDAALRRAPRAAARARAERADLADARRTTSATARRCWRPRARRGWRASSPSGSTARTRRAAAPRAG